MKIKEKLNRLIKQEDGQDMVEFAFVLPIFLLLVMGIIDFGWLFYNAISVENSARNAARIACVEYLDVPYNEDDHYNTYTYDNLDVAQGAQNSINTQEEDIVRTVKNSLPGSVSNVQIKVTYTYDTDTSRHLQGYEVTDRSTGDVTVEVKGDMKVLTPVLGVFSDHMKRTLTSSSTFKVEKQYNSNA